MSIEHDAQSTADVFFRLGFDDEAFREFVELLQSSSFGEAKVGEPTHDKLHEAVSRIRASGQGGTLSLTILRPKGKIGLAGASVSIGGGRKQGGYTLQVSTNDSGSRRSRHTLVCVDERCVAPHGAPPRARRI